MNISEKYSIVTSTLESWKRDITGSKNSIIVMDEFDVFCQPEFCTYYKDYAVKNNLWFVVIARIDSVYVTNHYKNMSYSVLSMYTLMTKDNITYNIPLFYYFLQKYKQGLTFDSILVEDSKAGYDFFMHLFYRYPVISVKSGKGAIIQALQEMINKGYKNILLFVDLAPYGCHIDELVMFETYNNVNIFVIDFYECFEYLLLSTNLLRNKKAVIKEFQNIDYYANQEYSWEKYFEALLKKVTDEKRYKQGNRGDLNPCYFEDCSMCNIYIQKNCDVALYGTKLLELLRGTQFEFLLNYV